jgi:hypothetical protein
MIEDEPHQKLKPRPEADNYGETLLYDYSKFLTSMSLLALGGVLSLSQTGDMAGVEPNRLLVILGAVAFGGATGVQVSSGIVSARSGGREPSRWLRRWLQLGTAALALGTGGFLSIFWDTLQ